MQTVRRAFGNYGGYAAWTIALLSLAGSLYFSEALGWVPCMLCWFTLILIYPIVAIGAVGILRRDKGWPLYALPLSNMELFLSF